LLIKEAPPCIPAGKDLSICCCCVAFPDAGEGAVNDVGINTSAAAVVTAPDDEETARVGAVVAEGVEQ
jgi:hypothetical protein